ncbi:hypothetical protein [Luteimonas deserti]|uniref:Uncharacterized protein n=1 Tax=Luteimonas deserti TaxID=2752306 RepID=A0A7Z0TWJ0_9GAMM|nr:hypothetical protein [Luteimonas deserti]NYZ63424.1 hypothetical protein [Luteimonas deserti]
MNREKVWEATSYAWTEIGLDSDDFARFAREAQLSPEERPALAHAVFWQVCGAFALETVFALLLMGVTLPDWFFPDPQQKVARWLRRPLLLSLLNPLWLVGYPLSCLFAFRYWYRLRKASAMLSRAA